MLKTDYNLPSPYPRNKFKLDEDDDYDDEIKREATGAESLMESSNTG